MEYPLRHLEAYQLAIPTSNRRVHDCVRNVWSNCRVPFRLLNFVFVSRPVAGRDTQRPVDTGMSGGPP
jgi:hypothetical protein